MIKVTAEFITVTDKKSNNRYSDKITKSVTSNALFPSPEDTLHLKYDFNYIFNYINYYINAFTRCFDMYM